jgi:hypothetical protein
MSVLGVGTLDLSKLRRYCAIAVGEGGYGICEVAVSCPRTSCNVPQRDMHEHLRLRGHSQINVRHWWPRGGCLYLRGQRMHV